MLTVRVHLEIEEFIVFHLLQNQRIDPVTTAAAGLTAVVPGILSSVIADRAVPGWFRATSRIGIADPDHAGALISAHEPPLGHTFSGLACVSGRTGIPVITGTTVQRPFATAAPWVTNGEDAGVARTTLQFLSRDADTRLTDLQAIAGIAI